MSQNCADHKFLHRSNWWERKRWSRHSSWLTWYNVFTVLCNLHVPFRNDCRPSRPKIFSCRRDDWIWNHYDFVWSWKVLKYTLAYLLHLYPGMTSSPYYMNCYEKNKYQLKSIFFNVNLYSFCAVYLKQLVGRE